MLVVVWTHRFNKSEVFPVGCQAAALYRDTRRPLVEDVIVLSRGVFPEDNLNGVQFLGRADMLVLRSVLLG